MNKAKVKNKQFKSSFNFNIDHINIDHQNTVPAVRGIDGTIEFNEVSDEEFFRELFQNREEFITEGVVSIAGVELKFISKMICTEMMVPLVTHEDPDPGTANLTSSGRVYLDFSGIDIEKSVMVVRSIYGE